jgi:hypothetical protein
MMDIERLKKLLKEYAECYSKDYYVNSEKATNIENELEKIGLSITIANREDERDYWYAYVCLEELEG